MHPVARQRMLSRGAGASVSTLNTGIVALWPLGEASGTSADSVGSNDLTDNNTVTQAVGKIGNAAQFTAANTEYLSIVDNAALSMGDVDFSIACWVYLDSKTTYRAITGKRSSNTKYEYEIIYESVADKFQFGVSSDGGVAGGLSAVTDDVLGSPSLSTWYFIVCTHDATANQIAISTNAGTATTTAHSGGAFDSDSAFQIGSSMASFRVPMDGRIDAVGVWKNKVLSAAEITELYNVGAGKEYPF